MTHFWWKWSARERAFLVTFAVTVAVSVFWQGVVRPFQNFMGELDNRIQSREIRLAKYRLWAQMGIQGVPASKTFSRTQEPGTAEEKMSALLKDIEKMARKSSVRIMNVRPLPIEKKGSYETLTVEVHSEASLPSLVHFLYDLKNSPQPLRIPRFTATTAEGSGRLHMDFSITQALTTSPPVKSR